LAAQLDRRNEKSLPCRHRKEGDYDSRINLAAGQGLMPVSEMNSNISRKQVCLISLQVCNTIRASVT
jgi:hypothetical protein